MLKKINILLLLLVGLSFPALVFSGSKDLNNSKPVPPAAKSATAYLKTGIEYALAAKFDKAKEEFEKGLNIDNLNYNLKQSLNTINDLNKGAIAQDCAFSFLKGTDYLTSANNEMAIVELEKSIQLNPLFAEAYFNLGNAYGKTGQVKQAMACLEKVIELDPLHARAYANLGLINHFVLNDFQRAVTYLEKAIQADPDYAQAYCDLGVVYSNLSKYPDAISYFKKAIQISPKNADAYDNLGKVYYATEKSSLARESFKKAKDLFQDKGDYQSAKDVEDRLKTIPQ